MNRYDNRTVFGGAATRQASARTNRGGDGLEDLGTSELHKREGVAAGARRYDSPLFVRAKSPTYGAPEIAVTRPRCYPRLTEASVLRN